MNELRILLALLGFVFASAAVGGEAKTAPTAQIGGIPVGLERSKIEQRLGKPISVTATGDALDPEIKYDGLTIWLWDGTRVAQIISTSSKYCASKNVCPGSKASTVQASFGSPQLHQTVQEGINSYLVATAETCWLNVIVERGTVQSLEIRCQP